MGKHREWTPFQDWLAENGRMPCKVKGCVKKRFGQGVYCQYHKGFYVRWGHPEARSVLPCHLKQEIEDIQKLISRNPGHPGILWGVDFLDKCMKVAAAGADVGGPGLGKWFAHLHDCREQFESLDLLTLLAAVTLLYRRDEIHRVIKNFKHYVILLGRHTVLFPRNRGGLKITDTAYRKVGPFIQEKLGPLLLNMARSTEAMLAKERTDKQAAHTEFKI